MGKPKPALPAKDHDDTVNKWNTSPLTVLSFLRDMERADFFYKQASHMAQLFTSSTIPYRNTTVAMSELHVLFLVNNPTTEWTFDKPSPTHAFEDRAVWPSILTDLGLTVSLGTTYAAYDDIPAAVREKFTINAPMIKQCDRDGCTTFGEYFESASYAQSEYKRVKYSVRDLVRGLFAKGNLAAEKQAEDNSDELQLHIKQGLLAPTVAGLNDFRDDLERLNDVLPTDHDAFLSETKIVNTCIRVAKLVGRNFAHDLKLALNLLPATASNQDKTDCLTTELTTLEIESAKHARNVDAHALAATPGSATRDGSRRSDARKSSLKAPGPKAEGRKERPAWTVADGKCKHCNKGDASGPNMGHWQSTCPIEVARQAAAAAAKKSAAAEAPPTAGSAAMAAPASNLDHAASDVAASSSFFASGSHSMSLADVEGLAPGEILQRLVVQ